MYLDVVARSCVSGLLKALRYSDTNTDGAVVIMFCSPQPDGMRTSLSKLSNVGPMMSPTNMHVQGGA